MIEDGQILLARGFTGDTTQPGSGSTVTLWTSDSPTLSYLDGARWKRIIVNLYSSHASAASGLQFDELPIGGSTWRNVISYSVSATTYTKSVVAVSSPYVRVRYVNSANVLTTWEFSVIGDAAERATQ